VSYQLATTPQRLGRRVAEYCVGKVGFATKQAKDFI